jgi:hypothetical protein
MHRYALISLWVMVPPLVLAPWLLRTSLTTAWCSAIRAEFPNGITTIVIFCEVFSLPCSLLSNVIISERSAIQKNHCPKFSRCLRRRNAPENLDSVNNLMAFAERKQKGIDRAFARSCHAFLIYRLSEN